MADDLNSVMASKSTLLRQWEEALDAMNRRDLTLEQVNKQKEDIQAERGIIKLQYDVRVISLFFFLSLHFAALISKIGMFSQQLSFFCFCFFFQIIISPIILQIKSCNECVHYAIISEKSSKRKERRVTIFVYL